MKKIILLITLSAYTFSSFSQDSPQKTKEVGLTFYNFDSYGAIYKIGKENKLWRFRILSANLNLQENSTGNHSTERNSLNFNFSIGKERRKSIRENLNFIYGLEVTGGFSFSDSKNILQNQPLSGEKTRHLQAGLIGIVGFNYTIKNRIVIGAELLPSAIYTNSLSTPYTSINSPSTSDAFSFGFNNQSALLSIALKF